MKNRRTFFQETPKIRSSGYAAVFAIVGILAVSLGAGVYIKRAQIFSSFSSTQSAQRLKEQEIMASAESARRLIIDRLNDKLEVSPSNQNSTAAAFNNFVAANIVDFYNNSAENQSLHQRITLRCANQIGPDPSNTLELQEQPCTFHRDRMPKSFFFVLQRDDTEQGITHKISQEFKIDRATINRFSYIITASDENIVLGNTTFEGPTGLFFASDAVSRNIIFAGQSGGTVFKDILFTSAESTAEFIHRTGAQSDFGRVAFNQPQVFTSTIDSIYTDMRAGRAGVNLYRPNQLQAALDACAAAFPAASCSAKPLSAYYQILPSCNIQIFEEAEWSYKVGAGAYRFGGKVQSNAVMQQTAGRVYALDGTALFHGAASADPGAMYQDAVICAPQTFLADSFLIGSSIVKSHQANNIWLLSPGNIGLQPEGYTVLCSNNSNTCASGSCSPCSTNGLTTAKDIKAGNRTISDNSVGLRIQATLTTSTGSFRIPESFMSPANGGGNVFPRLGRLETQGLIVASQPTFTSKTWVGNNNTYVAGFKGVTMRPEFRLVENPPPGLTFAVNIGLMQVLTSSSLNKIDINEAIKAIE